MDITPITNALAAFFTAISIYYVSLFAASVRRKRDAQVALQSWKPSTRFAVLVPAHNEERVIGDICRDLIAQDYPADLFRTIVIADNCSDGTEDIVKRHECTSLKCIARHSDIRGKGAALDYTLENLQVFLDGFEPDYVVVFDADNLVPADFLKALSTVCINNYPAIQCNVKTKNPSSSLLARSSYYEALTLQRLWQEGKDRLGLCNALSGTGEAIRYDLIRDLKFGNSLTDDLDLTIRLALKGLKVKYTAYPATFDEKPNRARVEVKRRIRWAAGHFQTFFKYGSDLLRRPSRLSLDALFYLTNITSPFVTIFSGIVSLLYMLEIVSYVPVPLFYSALLSSIFLILFFATSWIEGDRGFIKGMIPFYLLMSLWLIVAPVGLVKAIRGSAIWERTPHGEGM